MIDFNTSDGEFLRLYGLKDIYMLNLHEFNYTSKGGYLSDYITFDIETTSYQKNDDVIGFMYHFQFCLFKQKYIVVGRTWVEFVDIINVISDKLNLNENRKLICYVHNLSFEFQFIKDFLTWKKVFATENRKILTALTNTGVEFRCSYRLTNMSLEKLCETSKTCVHKKRVDDLDYTKFRDCDSILDKEELTYCIYDVLGLYEALEQFFEEDTTATIPLTSTGYVRREYRKAVQSNEKNIRLLKNTALDVDTYKLIKEVFRGGDTHASRYYANQIVKDVYSFDKQSSYPSVIANEYVPVSKFKKLKINSLEKFNEYRKKYCLIFTVSFFEIYTEHPFPYIPVAKCKKFNTIVNDNGRILSAKFLTISLTELDFEIIENTYKWSKMRVEVSYYAERGFFSKEIKNVMLDYFRKKTTLKNVDEYLYMKSKNRLNSTYGLMVCDIARDIISFNFETKKWDIPQKPDLTKALNDYYKSRNSFLIYQQGVYITAQARRLLWNAILLINPMDLIYIDTDSVKFINEKNLIVFEQLNEDIRKKCINTGGYINYKEKNWYLGEWENETEKGGYKNFKTLGAKKYSYVDTDDKFHLTVSGMNKKKGAEVVKCCENFEIGRTYSNIGRTCAWYNDDKIHYDILPNGKKILTASNIGILDTTYTLGVTNEYWELIKNN